MLNKRGFTGSNLATPFSQRRAEETASIQIHFTHKNRRRSRGRDRDWEIIDFLLMETQKNIWVSVLLLAAVFLQEKVSAGCNVQLCNPAADGSIYNYGAKTLTEGLHIPFSQYAGKYVLIVNVASF
ncbi:hypothetical protein HF521_001740 [Silurus meridionalis]|uniref:Glutathione peroxidase n=3 Tax=Silurus meridionalis TaxID=175797 RepID=A0A8T0B8C4_SILME|nr:hypothetical protein HF521_001740 [Silurus meridionalis]